MKKYKTPHILDKKMCSGFYIFFYKFIFKDKLLSVIIVCSGHLKKNSNF